MKLSPRQRDALLLVSQGRFYPDLVREEDGWFARWRGMVSNIWVDYFVRQALVTPLSAQAEHERYETLHDAWMAALKSVSGKVVWDDGECRDFAAELAAWHGALSASGTRFEFDSRTLEISTAVPRGRDSYRSLGEATCVFGCLRGLRRDGDRLKVKLAPGEADVFVRTGAKALCEAGYEVVGIEAKAEVSASAELAPIGKTEQTKVKLTVRVDGEVASAEEIRLMLEQRSNLVFFRDRWIEVDRNLLRQALRALERAGEMKLSRREAVWFASGIGRVGGVDLAEIAAGGWVRGLLERLRAKGELRFPGEVPGLNGTLRDYQKQGVAWLNFMSDNGFGALLADDMGLGKTIQAISWILCRPDPEPVLVAAPLTLLGNWTRELKRFAPQLKIYVHHGETRARGPGFERMAGAADVVLTSYSMLTRDYALFAGTKWSGMVVDEAQTIKNDKTRIARAVCKLRPRRRLALTGTPIENSLADIWSIEEFLNPGFLGGRKEFEERFAKPLAADPAAACGKKLKHALEPFVLRRLKSDPRVAGELGEKREIKEYCRLLPEDRREYEDALADFRMSERRHGDIFALITSLKLICDGEGKLEHLTALLDRIFAAGESAIVFTQYAKVGAKIARRMQEAYGRRFPFLHGALGARAREREIASFTGSAGPNAFILSLRAGGFGLNLTKATHVIHFDRWWNPAVENQATDRAHRIGQDKRVFVHTFITMGTIEEHVDEILERKANLSDIMGFADAEFFRLVGLS